MTPTMWRGTLALGLLLGLAAPAFAGPMYTFTLNQADTSAGFVSSTAGVVTLTQNGANVDVSYAPTPGWGILNTGGPHTPFAFTIDSPPGLAELSIISWTSPTGGAGPKGTFTLATGSASATPFGSYNAFLNYSAGNGSSKAYYGDLTFTLGFTDGTTLSTDDFIANAGKGGGNYFAVDATDPKGKTGSVAGNVRVGDPPVPVPEPASWAILAFGVAALGVFGWRREKRQAARLTRLA